jgi:hypothetical protein
MLGFDCAAAGAAINATAVNRATSTSTALRVSLIPLPLVVSRLMWKIGNGALPAPERNRGYHDVKRQARIRLHSHVDVSDHIEVSPHAQLSSRRVHPGRITAASCV